MGLFLHPQELTHANIQPGHMNTQWQNLTGRTEDPYGTEEVGIQKHDKLNDGQTQGWNYNKVERSATWIIYMYIYLVDVNLSLMLSNLRWYEMSD